VKAGEQGFQVAHGARRQLVVELASCVGEWERLLGGPSLDRDSALFALVRRCAALEAPSRGVGFGGVGHHLSELSRIVQTSSDIGAARQQLAVVKELLESARAALASESAAEEPQPAQSIAPPPLLHPGQSPVPVRLDAALAPPRWLTFAGQTPSPSTAPPPLDARGAPPAITQRPLPSNLQLPPAASPDPLPQPAPVAVSRPAPPSLLVRSVLGLRAFGRVEPGQARSRPSTQPPPPAAGGNGSVLGLQKRASSPSKPPPPLGGGYGGLQALRDPGTNGNGIPLPFDLGRAPLPKGSSDPGFGVERSDASSITTKRVRPGGRRRVMQRDEATGTRWWLGALAALGVCAVVLGIVFIAVTLTRRRDQPATTADGAPAASASGSPAPQSDSALPRSRLLTDDERFRTLLSQVHGRGKESPELRALLEEQASFAAQAIKPGCTGPECAALATVGKLVTETGKRRVQRRSHTPDSLRSRWLAGLEMPEIPVEDDPRVQKRFEFYTENPLGRETFQQMLFRCGAYKDTIQSALIRRGLPKDLIAVAYAESSCYPLAKSAVGAEGLWQFIPDAARAYHLRIIADVVDERHSPQKSTDAAIQYFSDLYAKFGSWDLVFSAYNMGPFGLAARLERVEGKDVGFWELVDAEMLPGETADYAPAIQAIALILNNLQRLKFGGIQQRAPQMTMDLQVPPTTRLTLIARAAALSLDDLRRLNLDIEGNSTPNVRNFSVQVPKDSVWQARDTLQELLKTGDESDLCAPANFDWGRQRFTPEMQEACTRNLRTRAAAAPAPGSAASANGPSQSSLGAH
jgi:Transglycosylase SLT domain